MKNLRQISVPVSPSVPNTVTMNGTFFRVVAILPATLSKQTGTAGSETAPGTVKGSTVGYLSSVLIRPSGGNFVPFKRGEGRTIEPGFSKLELQSMDSRSLIVVLVIGDRHDTNRVYNIPAESILISRGIQTAPASGTVIWFPSEILLPDGQVGVQRQVVVGNSGFTAALGTSGSYTKTMAVVNATNYVDGTSTFSTNDLIAFLPPAQLFTLETTSAIGIYNNIDSTPVDAYVTFSQVFNLIPASTNL